MLAINQDLVDEYIARGLKEDVPYEDVTTQAIYMGQQATVQLLAKESGIICGLAVFERVFQYLDPQTTCQWLVQEGDAVKPNDQLMQITGSVNTLLTGERVALNFFAENERNCNAYTLYGSSFGRQYDQTVRYEKNHPRLSLIRKICGKNWWRV